jgi:CDP-diacylglycerol--serine O-phosphatidyltransferase
LDSLADFVDFGVAPALVLYLSGLEKLKALGWMATLVFAIACSLRLARFNVMIDDPDMPAWRNTFFVGMPAPAGAIVGLLPVYCGFLVSASAPPPPFLWFELAYVLGVALLMASRVPHFSGKSIGRVPREYVAVVLIALAVALLLIVSYPLQALIALSLLYLASIPFSIRQFRRLRRENDFGVKSDFADKAVSP